MTLAQKTVLVVEDNVKNMKLVRALLKINGFKTIEATNAEKGIQLADRYQPDLILMDIQLPGMNGLQATREIRRKSVIPDVPVIALTSHAMEGDNSKAIEAGCNGYISKPINTRTFIDSISSHFSCIKNPSKKSK